MGEWWIRRQRCWYRQRREDIGQLAWWQCTFYSQIGFWLSSNFWKLFAQLLQALHYWLMLGDFFVSIMCTKCLIYQKLLLGWLISTFTHSPNCLQLFPGTQRNFSVYKNLHFHFLSSALPKVLQLGQHSLSIASPDSSLLGYLCPSGDFQVNPYKKYRRITQMNTVESKMELCLFSCVFLESKVSVPWVSNDYFKEFFFFYT